MKKGVFDRLLSVVLGAAFLFFIGLMLYPSVSNRWNRTHSSGLILQYGKSVSALSDEDYSDIWDAASKYNEDLDRSLLRFVPGDAEIEYYDMLLNPEGNGMMGYVEVPSVDILLPIYHGTSESVLQNGAGHVTGSSLPTGEPGTHTVLSGHRGLSWVKLFTYLDKVRLGDYIILYVMDRQFVYQVDAINVVLPDEMDLLAIEDGRDYCTLVTCTPYGVNSHRLLVRGSRVEDAVYVRDSNEVVIESENVAVQQDARRYLDIDDVMAGAAILLTAVMLLLLIFRKAGGRRHASVHEKANRRDAVGGLDDSGRAAGDGRVCGDRADGNTGDVSG